MLKAHQNPASESQIDNRGFARDSPRAHWDGEQWNDIASDLIDPDLECGLLPKHRLVVKGRVRGNDIILEAIVELDHWQVVPREPVGIDPPLSFYGGRGT